MSDPESSMLASDAARGVGILVSRTLALQLLTVGVTLVLARLLSPADYGLFALAASVQGVAQVASGVGLSAALIRQPEEPTLHQQRAVSGFLLASGLAFTIATQVVAFAILPAFGVSGDLVGVIATTSLAVPIYALRAVPMVLLERHLKFGRVAVVETAETLSFNIFALIGALVGLGAFSLAGAVPAAAAAGLVSARVLTRSRIGIGIDLGAIRELAHFGMRASLLQILTLSRGLGFVALITAVAGTSMAGFYTMGNRLFSLPTALASAMQRVSFPALARSARERPRLAARAASLSAMLVSLPLALLAGASQALVAVLLGDRWLPTADLVVASSPGVLLAASLTPAMIGLALSQGQPGPAIAAVACSAVALAIGCLIAVPPLGATGVGLAGSLAALVSVVVLSLRAEPEMRAAGPPLARALSIAAIAATAGYLLPLGNAWGGLVARICLITLVWLALAVAAMGPDLLAALRIARPMMPARFRDRAAN